MVDRLGGASQLHSLPRPLNLEESLPLMNEWEVGLNIVDICLTALCTPNVMGWLQQSMRNNDFYLKYRGFAEVMFGTDGKNKSKNSNLMQIFDENYVNGVQLGGESQFKVKEVIQNGKRKKWKSKCIYKKEFFIRKIDQLSEKMFKMKDQDYKVECFYSALKELSFYLSDKDDSWDTDSSQESIPEENLNQKIKDKKIIGQQWKQQKQQQKQQQEQQQRQKLKLKQEKQKQNQEKQKLQIQQIQKYKQKPQFQKNQIELTEKHKRIKKQNRYQGYVFYFNQQIMNVFEIHPQKSYLIKTRNRCPLVLDFGFKRFLYKNDDQLYHQLIAMQLIRYLNWILKKQYIRQYIIIPEFCGALYEFVEEAKTLNEIKSKFQSLEKYFLFISKNDPQVYDSMLRRFSQTYSGFCLVQYLLDLRDRNNANIMIGNDGSIFHIDLTFIFGVGPGGMNFETAPCKMTKQIITLMKGFDSDYFKLFETLFTQHFIKIENYREELIYKIKLFTKQNKEMKCFKDYKMGTFISKLPNDIEKAKAHVQQIIDDSFDSWKTNKYDDFQFKSNGIHK